MKISESEEKEIIMIGIAKWKEYFKWSKFPKLGFIHTLSPEEFKDLYCNSDNMENLISNIIEYYFCTEGNDSLVFIGEKGIGKTSFCYFLKKVVLPDKNLEDKYQIHILHVNSFLTGKQINPDLIYESLFQIISGLFDTRTKRRKDDDGKSIELGIKGNLVRGIIEGKGDFIVKINRLKNHIIALPKKDVIKRPIIILDDTDVYDYEVLVQISDIIFQALGPRFFFKCICFRPSDWKRIKRAPDSFLNSNFLTHEKIIPPSLYDILQKRFQAVGGYNFFSRKICLIIEKLNLHDIRESLGCIAKILDGLNPPDSKSNLRESIDEYMNKRFLKMLQILIKNDKIENLYIRENRFHRFLSLPKEIMLYVKIHSGNLANETFKDAFSKKFTGRYHIEGNYVQNTISHLINRGYLYAIEKDEYYLTPKGTIYCELLKAPGMYSETCIGLIEDIHDELFKSSKNSEWIKFSTENHFEDYYE